LCGFYSSGSFYTPFNGQKDKSILRDWKGAIMWATTKAIATIGVIYFVAGAGVMIGIGVGTMVANKIEGLLKSE
jgi:hypothetical protein